MIIDFHTHIFPPRLARERERYIQADPCFAQLYSDPRTRLATAEDLIESMDRNEIDMSVALNIGWTTAELCAETNDYILDSLVRYPGRLAAFCAVQPASPDAAREIERCLAGGAAGIGELRPDLQLPESGSPEALRPFMEVIREHNLPLLTHSSEPVGHTYNGKGDTTPDFLYRLALEYPDVTFVLAHWGGGLPFYALMPEVKQALSRVYFDSAASPLLYRPEVYIRVMELVGVDKILFGTDFPLLAQERLLAEVRGLSLPAAVEGAVLSGNACRLLGTETAGG